MRAWFSGRGGVLAAFVAGLVIATAATAGAASLITGKQIKDGSITARDLSKALRTQVAAKPLRGVKGDAGGPGPKGDAGPPGPGAIKVDTEIVSPTIASVTAATLGTLRVGLSGCQDVSGAATVHLVATTAATIALRWSWNGVDQSEVVQAIGPGSDYDFPLLLGTGSQLIHGIYRDAAGNVATLELVMRVINTGGTVRTCRISGALVPTA